MKVIVIGGGPAGMLAAISAAEQNCDVTILEKMDSLGKKLLITGKGRCNITNNAEMEEFFKNIPRNPRFLYSAFNNFSNNDIVQLLNDEGVNTKVERGGRIFPTSDRAMDVLEALIRKIKRLKIKIITNCKVEEIITEELNDEKKVIGVRTNKETLYADKIILATGGMSYPVTGSTGDGYEIASNLGHSITDIRPSLVPLEAYDESSLELCKELQGLSLRNVSIKVLINEKVIYQDFGEILFTHFGVSGPIILSSSSMLASYKDIDRLLKENKVKIQIDLKPALDVEKLDARILRDFDELKNKQFKNSLDKLLPQKMINPIIRLSKINPNKKTNEITKEERKRLVNILKCLEITVNDFRGIKEAIVTSGGINVKEINPKTMESKLVKGLFFAGEIIDVDALTGGFNLQIAYSTGFTAGGLYGV